MSDFAHYVDAIGKFINRLASKIRGNFLPLTLYSTITQLAYLIAHRYYGDVHFAWCAPGESYDRFDPKNPSSSHPVKLYREYLDNISSGDQHSARIDGNRIGLAKGAEARFEQGLIDQLGRDRVLKIIDSAKIQDFAPLMLVMPFDKVRNIAELAEVEDQASATSEEYIIKDLPRDHFDILRLQEIRA